MNPSASHLLELLGAAVLLIAAVGAVRWLWQYVWLPSQGQGSRLANRYGAGSWALITGASDGLGKAFALELGRYGFNLLLVSRTQAKLDHMQGLKK